jgi:hypothetical protein
MAIANGALSGLGVYNIQITLHSRVVRALRDDLAASGVVSKRRTAVDGSPYGGQKFSRGALYLMLKNRIYRGEIVHKGKPPRESTRRSSMKICGDECKATSEKTGWSGAKATEPSNQAC